MADVRTPKYLQAECRSDRWLISYVDIVTILLILFVAAAAQAVQHPAVPPATPSVQAPPPVRNPPAVAPDSPALLLARQKLQQQGIDMKLEQRGLVISLPQAALFASGQDVISPQAIPTISRIADVLRDMPNQVSLIGHADPTPIHSKRFSNNWELSAARSLRLLEFLTGRYGIAEDRLTVASQGSYNPKGPNDTEDGRAANRRVEIVILNDAAPR
jgi:chemotaxis protein MotB